AASPAAREGKASPAPLPSPGPGDGAGRRLYRCVLTIDPHADLPAGRAALALRRLESVGTITATSPGREALASQEFDGEMVVQLATERPQAAIMAAVKDLLDLQRFEVAELGLEKKAGPAAGARPEGGGDPPAGPSTVRVPTAALDLFLDAIAEMISRRGELAEAIRSKDLGAARGALDGMSETLARLRGQVMEIRLLPFEHITPRLTRAMRDLCRRTGKRAVLQIAGAAVAMDRSVLEEIIDPLLHILRNAVDHGILPPAEREAAGKSPVGIVRVEVIRGSDTVQVAVEDDGEGMDVEAIRRRAREGGYAGEAELAAWEDEQVLMLTTIPGFSTARQVTDISGRGVGMDVVRTRIEALRGHVAIRSHRGSGTRIELTLPLTVAILDAFVVESAAGLFAVPAGAVTSVQVVPRARMHKTLSGRFMAVGAEGSDPVYAPLLILDEALQRRRPASRPGELPVLHYQVRGARGGLAVDRILGRQEVVVKPLGPPLERLRKYSGAALLDDGRLALVLDLANLGALA
ncbi:MAG TPA: ATP-binding protein, partial [Candidatus Polarisedimenticolia bacterium]|nr:ATP-binding protein [Candidatus Polarisedimenticolia bacterium]